MLDIPKTATTTTTPEPNYAAIKQRQQATWAAGDYAMIGTTLQIVGETLCEAVDLHSNQRVLDGIDVSCETGEVACQSLQCIALAVNFFARPNTQATQHRHRRTPSLNGMQQKER